MSIASDKKPRLLDYSETLGRFLLISPQRKLFALDSVFLRTDVWQLVPRLNSTSLSTLDPMIASDRPSRIVMVLHPGDAAHAYFLMDMTAGPIKRTTKVFNQANELIEGLVRDGQLPLVDLVELQKATGRSRIRKSPISVRVRVLSLRSGLPRVWTKAIGEVFLAAAGSPQARAPLVADAAQKLELALRRRMVEQYLSKCVWLDAETDLLGRLKRSGESGRFSLSVERDQQLEAFRAGIAKDLDGRLVARSSIANVVPELMPGVPWTAPTLHVYDDAAREELKLDEYSSLYRGLQRLSGSGAPVLVREGSTLSKAIPVFILQPELKDDFVTQLMTREFPTQEILAKPP